MRDVWEGVKGRWRGCGGRGGGSKPAGIHLDLGRSKAAKSLYLSAFSCFLLEQLSSIQVSIEMVQFSR